MKRYLMAILAASFIAGPALAYDRQLASNYETFFAGFEEQAIAKAVGRIPAAKVVEAIKKGEDLVILDVRTRKEQSGKGRALRPTPPLRTRRASFPAPGSSLDKAPRSTRRLNIQSPSRYGVVPN